MIQAASKYQPVPAAHERRAAPGCSSTPSTAKLVQQAVRSPNKKRTVALRSKFPHVFIPAFNALIGWRDWATRELRTGGLFERHLDWERRTSAARFRAVQKARNGYQHNPKSDTRLVASIPVQEFWRARQVDKDFWSDNSNLRNYKRDNPEAFIRL
jgi:hypothetical protein